jgi:hypothetical protein
MVETRTTISDGVEAFLALFSSGRLGFGVEGFVFEASRPEIV